MNEMNNGEYETTQTRRRKPGKSKYKAANPLRNTLQVDIENLLLRFFLSSPSGLSSLSFDKFKECWSIPDKHFTLIHYTFATSRVDYNKLLQSMFQITLSYLDHVPIEKLQELSPELYGPDQADFELLSAAWNMSVIFCLYCIHGTQFEVNYQDSKASNKSHMEVMAHTELEEKTPIRIAMSIYMRLVITANLQLKPFFDTQLGRYTFAILDHLMSANAFCYSAFTGPVLHEEFDEKPGNTSNHIIESINLGEIWIQKKKQYSELMKKKTLISATFPGHVRADHNSRAVVHDDMMEVEAVDNTTENVVPQQIPSSSRRPVYIGYKGSKVQDDTRKKTAIQKARKEKSPKEMEHVTNVLEMRVAMEQESTLQPEQTLKSSDALAEELAAMFDTSSSSTNSFDTTRNLPVVNNNNGYETHITELTRLEQETDEVLTMEPLQTSLKHRTDSVGIVQTKSRRVRRDTSSRRVRNGINPKRSSGSNNNNNNNSTSSDGGSSSNMRRKEGKRDDPARTYLEILEGLEDNLHEILDS